MKTIAIATAALSVLGAIAVATPASAAVGQCFDAYGRPLGPPHNTDNPPYALLCQAYRIGGHCTHVGAGWAESTCPGMAPRYGYRNYHDDGYRPRYRSRQYDHSPRYNRGKPLDPEVRQYLRPYTPTPRDLNDTAR
jgi:hypothetical protein